MFTKSLKFLKILIYSFKKVYILKQYTVLPPTKGDIITWPEILSLVVNAVKKNVYVWCKVTPELDTLW